jgi:hypothetical protein
MDSSATCTPWHSSELVGTDGTIDYCCCPRFDSPSVFAALLDADRGGRFRIAPAGDGWVSKQLNLPDTAVLVTRFSTPGGVGEVQDFMPPENGAGAHRPRLIRRIVADADVRAEFELSAGETAVFVLDVVRPGDDPDPCPDAEVDAASAGQATRAGGARWCTVPR